MEIKEMLIQIREKNGYTKKEVSEKTGIPYTTYIKYESGERKDVSMQALCKLADFYNVSTDYLLGREEKTNPFESLNLLSGEKSAMEKYIELPENIRKIILDTMLTLSDAARQKSDDE